MLVAGTFSLLLCHNTKAKPLPASTTFSSVLQLALNTPVTARQATFTCEKH